MTHGLDAKHYVTPDTPEECLFPMSSSFETPLFWVIAPVYDYLDWYLQQNRRGKYSEYRLWLQVLQASSPKRRLILKAPEHTGALDALYQAVPEARLIQMHRDPVAVFASFVSLNLTTQSLATDGLDTHRNASANLRLLEAEAGRNVSTRERCRIEVCDVSYDELVADPVGTVRSVYERHSLTFTDVFERRLARYVAENPQHKHGAHRYAARDFGFSDDVVRERFAAYTERFGSTE